MIIRKLRYGLRRLSDDLRGKEDYWHPRLKPMTGDLYNPKIYFHDMYAKGFFPGEFSNGIPLTSLYGNQSVVFHIDVFNYSLGLINRYILNEDVSNNIMYILRWTLENQLKDGSWRYNFTQNHHPLSENKASGMTQGLAVSFIIRSYRCGFISREECMASVRAAIDFMLSAELVSEYDGYKLIEEFYNPGHGVLNGAIFAIYGLYDYCYEINNFEVFMNYISDLKGLMNKFKLNGWSFYDIKGMVASKFYHQLHIDMMHVLYWLTNDSFFLEYANYWSRGKRYSVLFTFMKSFQKLRDIRKMPFIS
jgi:hypothetical protein